MFRSYEVSSVITVAISFIVATQYAQDWRLAVLTAIGVGLAVAFNPLTSYFTSTKKSPVKDIVKSTKTGPATTILSGLSIEWNPASGLCSLLPFPSFLVWLYIQLMVLFTSYMGLL